MINHFNNLSIKKKLVVIIFTSITLALFLAFLLDTFYMVKIYRENMVNKIESAMHVVAQNLVVSIEFDNSLVGNKILMSLSSIPEVLAAEVYDGEKKKFSVFKRNERIVFPDKSKFADGIRFDDDHLYLSRQFNLFDGNYGEIRVLATTKSMIQQIYKHVFFSFLIVVVISIIMGLAGFKMSELITNPILKLADTALAITERDDYSIRIKSVYNDEIGMLYNKFNDMLDQISFKDEEIRAFNRELEIKVQERTAELKETNKILGETTDFLNKLFESSALSTWLSDDKGTAIRANQACLNFYGAKEEEVLGKYNLFKDIVIERSGFMPEIERVFKNGEVASIVIDYDFGAVDHVRVPNATHKIINSVFTPLIGDRGNVTNVIVQTIDLTEIKKTELLLRESEEKYRSLYNNTPVMMHSINQDGKLISVSEYWLQEMGYTWDEVIGRRSTEFLTETSCQYAKEVIIPEFFKTGYCKDVPYQFIKKNGQIIDVLMSAISEKDKAGKVIRSLAVIINITERKKAEEALRKSERLLRTIADNYPNSYLSIINKDLTVGYTSGQEFKKLQLDPNSFVGMSLDQVFGNRTPVVKAHYLETFKGLETQFELIFNDQNQLYRTVPLFDDNGEIPRILSVVENITDRKQAEQQLQDAYEERGVLLREIHHRVKNNLQTIISLLNKQKQYIGDQKFHAVLDDSMNRIRSMALIHDQICRTKNLSKICIGDYIREFTRKLFSTIHLHSSNVTLNIKTDEIYLPIDTAVPLALTINELMTNALKYGFPDNRQGNIWVECINENDEICLIVRDDGIGFPSNFKIENVDSLGLYLVYNIATRQLRGSLDFNQNGITEFLIKFKNRNEINENKDFIG